MYRRHIRRDCIRCRSRIIKGPVLILVAYRMMCLIVQSLGDCPFIANSKKAAVLEFLVGLLFRIDLVIRLKGRWNQIFGPKLTSKLPKFRNIHILRATNCRKLIDLSKWPHNLIYSKFFKVRISLRQPEMSIVKVG